MNKSRIADLAVCGGSPTFKEKLHVGRPNIGNRKALMQRIDNLLDRRWLTNNGPFVREFENKIAQLTYTKHCIAMCNATTALEIAIRALELRERLLFLHLHLSPLLTPFNGRRLPRYFVILIL